MLIETYQNSYLILDEKTNEAVMINVPEVSFKLVNRLNQIELRYILITDLTKQVYDNLNVLKRLVNVPVIKTDVCVGNLKIKSIKLRNTSIYQINSYLFVGSNDITELLDNLDKDLLIISTNTCICSVDLKQRILSEHLKQSILSQTY